jgi:hypothetical protein
VCDRLWAYPTCPQRFYCVGVNYSTKFFDSVPFPDTCGPSECRSGHNDCGKYA